MKISVENYGIIAKAEDMDIRPLTVFTGPNNSGKSTLATLIYAYEHSHSTIVNELVSWPTALLRQSKLQFIDAETITPKIEACLDKTLSGELSAAEWPQYFYKWLNRAIVHLLNRGLIREISRCTGVAKGGNGWDSLVLHGFSLSAILDNEGSKIVFRKNPEHTEKLVSKQFMDHYAHFKMPSVPKETCSQLEKEEKAAILLIPVCFHVRALHQDRNCYYLPAARTGIMQSLLPMMSLSIQNAHSGLNGILSDFINDMLRMEAQQSPIADVAKIVALMEKKMLKGEVIFSKSEGIPRFSYRSQGIEVPMARASSMATELVPLALLLKHQSIKKDDWLFIEEPEAHLHPSMQMKMAEIIVRLVRAKVRVLVTTHSDYFLDRLAWHISLSELGENAKPKEKEMALPEKDVAAYRFLPETQEGIDSGKTIVKRFEFDAESAGFAPYEINKASSDLYNDTARVLDRIDHQAQTLKDDEQNQERK